MIFGRGLSDPELREAALRLFTRQNFPKLDTLVVNMTDPAPVFDALEQNDLAIKNLKVVTYEADALTHLLSGEYLAHIEVLDMSSLDCYHSKLLDTVFASPHLKSLRAVVVDGWPSFKYVTQALRAHPGLDSPASSQDEGPWILGAHSARDDLDPGARCLRRALRTRALGRMPELLRRGSTNPTGAQPRGKYTTSTPGRARPKQASSSPPAGTYAPRSQRRPRRHARSRRGRARACATPPTHTRRSASLAWVWYTCAR